MPLNIIVPITHINRASSNKTKFSYCTKGANDLLGRSITISVNIRDNILQFMSLNNNAQLTCCLPNVISIISSPCLGNETNLKLFSNQCYHKFRLVCLCILCHPCAHNRGPKVITKALLTLLSSLNNNLL